MPISPLSTNRASAGSPISVTTAAPVPTAQSADRKAGAQRHLDCRCHRSEARSILLIFRASRARTRTGGAQMVRVCDGSVLPSATKPAYTCCAASADRRTRSGTSPTRPSQCVTRHRRLHDTHKSWWECDTGIAFLVSGLPDWRTRRMTQIYDLSDPAKPVSSATSACRASSRARRVPVPTELHGAISTGPKGNRFYFGYGTDNSGIVQIVDREKLLKGPTEPTEANLARPRGGRASKLPTGKAPTRRSRCSDAGRRVRPTTRTAQDARHRHDRRRVDPERVPRDPADGAVRRHHDREAGRW